MKILVTGGAGFIGSHIVEHFQAIATEIRVLDSLRTGNMNNLHGLRHTFVKGCVTDRATVARSVAGVQHVFHLAAMVSVPESMENPVECLEVNSRGTLVLLEESVRAGVESFCLSSSAAIYGNHPAPEKTEDLPPEPLSPYAITKLDGEYLCAMFSRRSSLRAIALRYFNVFGPRQSPTGAYAAAVPIFFEQARKNHPILVHGDGLQTRDFIYVKDVAAANAHFALHSQTTGVFNVARGGTMTILDLASSIIASVGSSSPIHFGEPRPGDIRHSRACIKRLTQSGFTASHSLHDGLAAIANR